MKVAMKSYFRRNLSVPMKAELRKNLKQNQDESVTDFSQRCKHAEKLIWEDMTNKDTEALFERDVLLTFLIGLREDLQLKVMQSDGSNLEDFLKIALQVELAATKGHDQEFVKTEDSYLGLDLMDYINDDDNDQDEHDDDLVSDEIKHEESEDSEDHSCTQCDMPFKVSF